MNIQKFQEIREFKIEPLGSAEELDDIMNRKSRDISIDSDVYELMNTREFERAMKRKAFSAKVLYSSGRDLFEADQSVDFSDILRTFSLLSGSGYKFCPIEFGIRFLLEHYREMPSGLTHLATNFQHGDVHERHVFITFIKSGSNVSIEATQCYSDQKFWPDCKWLFINN